MISTGRFAARMDGEFVVFLIGMRFNRPWKIWKWWPVASAMPKMLAELAKHPEMGYLGGHAWFGQTIITLQYWRSFEQLERYAHNRDAAHLPAWTAFNKQIGASGDVGVWHETYRVKPGLYENIYVNMPPFGLGAIGTRVPAVGSMHAAAQRIQSS
ncbi:MAG TPA: DUF4188 domain-containing protein [Candidatus Eremiobacteraceae bacterium]|jgi:hypothetical protein|nr:DUF4188 domain-containing protein [Candidatus Eremiobacteraceae bacterium]